MNLLDSVSSAQSILSFSGTCLTSSVFAATSLGATKRFIGFINQGLMMNSLKNGALGGMAIATAFRIAQYIASKTGHERLAYSMKNFRAVGGEFCTAAFAGSLIGSAESVALYGISASSFLQGAIVIGSLSALVPVLYAWLRTEARR